MKNITDTLLTFLTSTAASEICVCDLLKIGTNDGTILYFTNADVDIVWSGHTYSSGAGNITFTRTKTSSKIGTQVAEMDLTLMANSSAMIEGIPAIQYIRNAGLDAAQVRLDRLYLSAWNAPVGIINNFLGRVSNLDVTRTAAKIKVKSYMVMLDLQLPKNQYQPTCLHSLYDTGCGLNRASYAYTGTVTGSASTVMSVNTTLTQAAGFFTQGYVQFSSGQNSGSRRTILASSGGGVLSLAMPLEYVPAAGDAFTAYVGCDHTQSTCTSKFGNEANFRGFPFVPVPETAL